MNIFRQELNSEQLAVVTAEDGPLLVVAGAGSGKTRTLIYRLARLVERGTAPSNILLMTFTNRAAREMMLRAEHLLQTSITGLRGGTFHHIANLALRRFGPRIDLDPEYTIMDQEDAKRLMRGCLAELGLTKKKRRFPNQGTILAISGLVQNTLTNITDVLNERFPMFSEEEEDMVEVLQLYREQKGKAKLVDFDDLLNFFYRLLKEDRHSRDILSDRFHHILVDEYQDTSKLQGEIVDCLAGNRRNLCAVGDDAQAIYGFRGASFANIIDFPNRYPEARVFRLERNYRSLPAILNLANANIAVNSKRWPKELTPVRSSGELPSFIICRDGDQQAKAIAEQIKNLLHAELLPSQIAVLYRSHYHSMEIQLTLQRNGIPFQVRGGLRFFEQAHVKDTVAFLRILHNPRDRTSWLRVLTMLRGVGERTAERFCNQLSTVADPLDTALSPAAANWFPSKARPAFSELSSLLATIREWQNDPAAILDRIINQLYYDYMLSNYSSPQRRREDLRGVINFASKYTDMNLFLGDIALATEYYGDADGKPSASPDESEAVVLSTIHQAKGLEWKAVIIPWLVESRFPAPQALDSKEDLEEERRIFHVAVTRAADRLYLFAPRFQFERKNQEVKNLMFSRFIRELPETVFYPIALDRKFSKNNTPGDSAFKQRQEEWTDDDLPVVYLD